jgi:hypothetical protein
MKVTQGQFALLPDLSSHGTARAAQPDAVL